jgi:cyanoexosortase A
MNQLKFIQKSQFWLLGIATGLMTLSIHLAMKSEFTDLGGTTFLFWVAVASQLWKKRHILNLHSGIFSTLLGVSIITLVIFKCQFPYVDESFLRISPILSLLGFALLASGVKGLKQYWQELLLLGFIAIPQHWLSQLINLPKLTAKFATFSLLYLGFPAQNEGYLVKLPTSFVEVDSGCSGISLIFQLLGIALIFLVLFSPKKSQVFLIPSIAIILAFILNGVRVSLMAYLNTYSQKSAFEYWHEGNGSLIFSLIGVILFGYFGNFLLKPHTANKGERVE